jgi:TFIIF-interacting CTD phosphatase-like protein
MFDPGNKYFVHRLYRNECTIVDSLYIKDLSSLGRPLESTVIVDNSAYVFGYHVTNGIPIESFFGQPWDQELIALVSQLSSYSVKLDSFAFNHSSP